MRRQVLALGEEATEVDDPAYARLAGRLPEGQRGAPVPCLEPTSGAERVDEVLGDVDPGERG